MSTKIMKLENQNLLVANEPSSSKDKDQKPIKYSMCRKQQIAIFLLVLLIKNEYMYYYIF